MALRFYRDQVSKFSVALGATSKGIRCKQDVKICGFACKQSEDVIQSSHGGFN